MSDKPYILAAYGITWIVLAGYMTYLLARARRARHAAAGARPGGRDV
jgi:CcmD family protein